jgi:hypothetical protein
MEEQNNLPPIPPAEPIPEFLAGDHWFEEDIGNDFLDFTEPYTPPRYTLERLGVPFANVGELHIVSGKAGHGKTHLMIQFMSAILGGHCGGTYYRLTEQRPKPIVLYVDTEQGKDDTIALKNKVCKLAQIPHDQPSAQMKILRLRDTETAIERWRKILKAVWMVKPTDIFIDGMLDIVEDYNDQVECQPVIRKCMMLATYYDASLWMVLHENPMVDKLVGVLGSITQRKVAEIFTVRKHIQSRESGRKKDNRPDIYFTVDQVKARNRDVASWDFEIAIEDGWAVPRECTDSAPMPEFTTEHTPEELKEWITDKWNTLKWPASRTDVENHIFKPNGVTDAKELKELMTICINRRFLVLQSKDEMEQGQKNPRLKINEDIILPI